MSINAKQSVRCPKCSQMSDVTIWTSITAKDSPDLKSDLLHRAINMFHCPVCSYSALMPNPLLYHDEDRRLMISFCPVNNNREGQEMFKRMSKASDELDKFEEYNLRFVTDYNDMLEKILIFDNGLNDKAVEVIKLMIMSQDIDKSEQRVCRFGKKDISGLEFMVYDYKEAQTYTSTVPIKTYDDIYNSLKESGMKPYSFGWEEVNSSYATRLLNGFNNNF